MRAWTKKLSRSFCGQTRFVVRELRVKVFESFAHYSASFLITGKARGFKIFRIFFASLPLPRYVVSGHFLIGNHTPTNPAFSPGTVWRFNRPSQECFHSIPQPLTANTKGFFRFSRNAHPRFLARFSRAITPSWATGSGSVLACSHSHNVRAGTSNNVAASACVRLRRARSAFIKSEKVMELSAGCEKRSAARKVACNGMAVIMEQINLHFERRSKAGFDGFHDFIVITFIGRAVNFPLALDGDKRREFVCFFDVLNRYFVCFIHVIRVADSASQSTTIFADSAIICKPLITNENNYYGASGDTRLFL